ncbi:Pex19p NDAI_0D04370 [Naumovozyma dairenensis CBS 421]|uniref:Uncharacterized protein n=1 Tax=Naumovozyma dairenensis (strain ATCC 10597 / BCRC 20456 / CBS 421 / NBRC 0211 / NRRL Y-12639) TaxID=1071378 RepID=G0WAE0_NAUDC|nr:hypothetical protein NDAI_0D04370 [Naumovozyma dairenensis CBS 421]CCD24751.1 hypothetical protein NDAI_0D04370 [Naumovozyma dairenensis CBS 421]
MSTHFSDEEEYDDLDDLLDEDPATLDQSDIKVKLNNTDSKDSINVINDNDKEEEKTRSISEKVEDNATIDNGTTNARSNANNKEVQNMIDEFAGLMKNQKKSQDESKNGDIDEEEDAKLMEKFTNVLNTLDNVTKHPQTSVKNDNTTTTTTTTTATNNVMGNDKEDDEEGGFHKIVSKTLDRLKENDKKINDKLSDENNGGKKNKNVSSSENGNPDDILSSLLDQLVQGGEQGEGDIGEDGMDNAILNILNQMSSKEVLHQPMKEMYLEFDEWFKDHREEEEFKDKIVTYDKQYLIIGKIVTLYEKDDYTNDLYRDEITNLLDELEQLGDTPVGNVNAGAANGSSNNNTTMDDFSKLLNIDGLGDDNMDGFDEKLKDTCNQQ